MLLDVSNINFMKHLFIYLTLLVQQKITIIFFLRQTELNFEYTKLLILFEITLKFMILKGYCIGRNNIPYSLKIILNAEYDNTKSFFPSNFPLFFGQISIMDPSYQRL